MNAHGPGFRSDGAAHALPELRAERGGQTDLLGENRGIIVAEAFLYAPDREKEVVLQRLEEALQTLRME